MQFSIPFPLVLHYWVTITIYSPCITAILLLMEEILHHFDTAQKKHSTALFYIGNDTPKNLLGHMTKHFAPPQFVMSSMLKRACGVYMVFCIICW